MSVCRSASADGPADEFLTDRLTAEACAWIEKNKDATFFLYLPHYAVHTPLRAKQQIIDKYKGTQVHGRQNHPVYAAMVDNVSPASTVTPYSKVP